VSLHWLSTAAASPKLSLKSSLAAINNTFFHFTSNPIQSHKSINMLRTFTRNTVSKTFKPSSAASLRVRGMADKRVEDLSQAAGEAKDTNPKNPSVVSSGGAVGKQFNPDGAIGQVGEAVRTSFSLLHKTHHTDKQFATGWWTFLQGRRHWLSVRRI
jgi:uncharacterized protein with von Willebrand factor type A (vWA) domain